jgi:imidazole glycerol-phosphate synthase subunit HisH
LDYLGEECIITSNPKKILGSDKVIFPGVGNFGDVMKELKKRKLDYVIKKVIGMKKPFLGICVGLQVLFEESEESPNIKGLGIFEGKVVKFPKGKIPQIGWNKIISKTIGNGHVYFVNSYYAVPSDKGLIESTSDYHIKFTAAVKKGNVFATQFHPEKSGEFGLQILGKWLSC